MALTVDAKPAETLGGDTDRVTYCAAGTEEITTQASSTSSDDALSMLR
jgi:hypothetical protein